VSLSCGKVIITRSCMTITPPNGNQRILRFIAKCIRKQSTSNIYAHCDPLLLLLFAFSLFPLAHVFSDIGRPMPFQLVDNCVPFWYHLIQFRTRNAFCLVTRLRVNLTVRSHRNTQCNNEREYWGVLSVCRYTQLSSARMCVRVQAISRISSVTLENSRRQSKG